LSSSSRPGNIVGIFLGEYQQEWIKEPFDVGQVALFSESATNQSNGVIEMPLKKQLVPLR
jgi:hypothetical protein